MMQWCPDDSKFRLISIRIYICSQDRQLQNQSSYIPDSFSISASLYFHRLLSYPSLICSKIIISFILQSACVSCVLSVETNNRLWFVLFATDMDVDMKCYCCHHIYISWWEFQTFLCLIYIYLIPLHHTHTNYTCDYRCPGPVIRQCGVGRWCLSRPPAKDRARVRTLIGWEKPCSITVYLCARTGKIKGWLWEREEGVEKDSQNTQTQRKGEEKVIQWQGDRENSEFWKHRRDRKAGKEKIDREDK